MGTNITSPFGDRSGEHATMYLLDTVYMLAPKS